MRHREIPLHKTLPMRTLLQEQSFYDDIDNGIRFPLKVLHAAGLETCQSCEGGNGHSYDDPTIDMLYAGRSAAGFAAVDALTEYGIVTENVGIQWRIENGVPTEPIWRIVLRDQHPDRADDWPMFVRFYRHIDADLHQPQETQL